MRVRQRVPGTECQSALGQWQLFYVGDFAWVGTITAVGNFNVGTQGFHPCMPIVLRLWTPWPELRSSQFSGNTTLVVFKPDLTRTYCTRLECHVLLPNGRAREAVSS